MDAVLGGAIVTAMGAVMVAFITVRGQKRIADREQKQRETDAQIALAKVQMEGWPAFARVLTEDNERLRRRVETLERQVDYCEQHHEE